MVIYFNLIVFNSYKTINSFGALIAPIPIDLRSLATANSWVGDRLGTLGGIACIPMELIGEGYESQPLS